MLNNVLVVTTSEFGRRVKENGSKGTDHGTAAPIFLYGTSLRGKILGSQPSLSDLDSKGNVKIQYDYRSAILSVSCTCAFDLEWSFRLGRFSV